MTEAYLNGIYGPFTLPVLFGSRGQFSRFEMPKRAKAPEYRRACHLNANNPEFVIWLDRLCDELGVTKAEVLDQSLALFAARFGLSSPPPRTVRGADSCDWCSRTPFAGQVSLRQYNSAPIARR